MIEKVCAFSKKMFAKQGCIGKEKAGNTGSITKESGERTGMEKKCTAFKTGRERLCRAAEFWQRNTLALTAVIFLAALVVWTAADGQSFAQGCSQLYDGVLRLHILANSDSESDQQLKLRVRDRVLQTAQQLGLGENCTELPQLLEQTQQLLGQLEQAAQQEVWRSGSDQKVKAYLTRMYFDTREYEDFTMPAGVYRTVRFTIGKGEGKNWWCVLFPQMCIPTAVQPAAEFSDEQLRVLERRPQYEPKFALLELFYSLTGENALDKRQAEGL